MLRSTLQQNHLLIDPMEGLKKKCAELMPLPGEDFRTHNNRLMRQYKVQERINAYIDLNIKYAQCSIKLEAAQLILDVDEQRTEKYNQEVLISRISNILDKIMNSFIKDNVHRRREGRQLFSCQSSMPEPQLSHQ